VTGKGGWLWLDPISPVLRERATRAFECGDVSGFLCTAGNEYGFYLVAHNLARLREAGLYEAALLEAYAATRVNNARHLEAFLKSLFRYGDRSKFREAGDPLPGPGPFTLYRGVAGEGEQRRERGLSWTLDLDAAWWFAYWFHLQKREDAPANPAVVTITVEESDVIAYANDSGKNDQDFIVLVPDTATLQTMPADGGLEAARRYEQRKQETIAQGLSLDDIHRELA
jgi:hypothetical protein